MTTSWFADKIEQWPTAKLLPYARNARTHSDEQIAQIAASINEFGFTNPILVGSDGVIVAGHGRYAAAQRLGLSKVPVVVLDHLSETQRRALVIADNRIAENAGWDDLMLSNEFAELAIEGFDLSLTGFNDEEISGLTPNVVGEGLTDPDDAPEVQENAISELGDVWLLGNHRLMCGDSTSIADAEKLMNGGLADMAFTDPPYNVAYSGRGEKNKLGSIMNDDMSADDFQVFCREVFATYHSVMKPLACIYVCHADSQSAPKIAFEIAFAENFKKSSTIIWMKQSAGMGWQDYRAQHEPILYGWKEGNGSHFYCGDRSKTTVWQIGRDAQASYVHPTQKPVALPEEAIVNSSKGADIVLDLFGGSGSTLIACEKSGRYARLMELDPKYCDVIIKRWQNFTGQDAIHADSGNTFNSMVAN